MLWMRHEGFPPVIVCHWRREHPDAGQLLDPIDAGPERLQDTVLEVVSFVSEVLILQRTIPSEVGLDAVECLIGHLFTAVGLRHLNEFDDLSQHVEVRKVHVPQPLDI